MTEEDGPAAGAQTMNLMRIANPRLAVIVAGVVGGPAHVPVGSTGLLDGRGLVGQVRNTGKPSRVEDFDDVGGAVADAMREPRPPLGGRRAGDRRRPDLGALAACSAAPVPLPAGTEDRIAAFAQLISLAIENAESREDLAASPDAS